MTIPANQSFWDVFNRNAAFRYDEDSLPFKEVFATYLRPGGDCFEVGCYPGRFLVYLGRRFGYTANGIDTAPHVKDRMTDFLRTHNVVIGNLHQGDFFTFETKNTYDLVCSFGFIEHFTGLEDTIRRHVSLVKPGGRLILSSPNYRKVQYVLHRWLDPENLNHHVLANMDLRLWSRILKKLGMQILYCGYYRTADFWVGESTSHLRFRRWAARRIRRLFRAVDKLVDWPNPYVSPHMICVAQKMLSKTRGST